jgi:hypothetical protein
MQYQLSHQPMKENNDEAVSGDFSRYAATLARRGELAGQAPGRFLLN